MTRLALPSVTIVAIDTRLPDLAVSAMVRSMANIDFGDAIAFVPESYSDKATPVGIRMKPVGAIDSSKAYSEFVFKRLVDHIQTEHVLIVQWDGFVVHAHLWQEHFLNYDYLGAPWPQFNDDHRVGNGGFSLRSKRLMKLLQTDQFVEFHPEDVAIGRIYRTQLENDFGVKFPTCAFAEKFAVERQGDVRAAFGCHGLANMAAALESSELDELVRKLPNEVYLSTEARGFVKNLLNIQRADLASLVLTHRTRLEGWSVASLRLKLRIWFYLFLTFFR